jgi:hypothetical protein
VHINCVRILGRPMILSFNLAFLLTVYQVVGGGALGEAALAATGESGFFVCRVNNSTHEVSTFCLLGQRCNILVLMF